MAAIKYVSPIDLSQLELQNAVVQLLASDPGSPVNGQVWINSTSWTLKVRLNGVTVLLGRLDQISAPTAAVNFNGQQATTLLIEQLASDPGSPADGRIWSNTTTGVLKIRQGGVTYVLGRLDQLNAPTGPLAMNGQKITGMADGTAATDAVTKQQLDASTAGLDVKQSVRMATTANIANLLTGAPNTVDGVTPVVGDRILVKDQSTASGNGIYTVTTVGTGANGVWARAADADASAEVTAGMYTFVEEGTVNADTGWVLTTNNPITLGTTALAFSKFTAAASGTARFTQLIGDGSTTAIAVTHNLGVQHPVATVYDAASNAEVMVDKVATSTTVMTFNFAVAPASNAYRVVIVA